MRRPGFRRSRSPTRAGRASRTAPTCLRGSPPLEQGSVERLFARISEDIEAASDAIRRVDESLLVDDHVIDLDRPARVFRRRGGYEEAHFLDAGWGSPERHVDDAINADSAVEEAADERVLEL